MSKSWKCRIGRHRWYQRQDTQDPSAKICLRGKKHGNMGTGAFGGLLGPETGTGQ